MPAIAPDIVRRQAVIGAAALSPDGEQVVYTRRTVAGDRYQTSLWLVRYGGGRPRRLTSGRWNDGAPAWSPDGTEIAFLSDRGGDDAPAALYLIRPDGGEAERVCGAPAWRCRRACVVARRRPDRLHGRGRRAALLGRRSEASAGRA